MKLKAPPGVGDPCVAGVAIAARDGVYDVEAEIGVLLVEAFGFIALETADRPRVAPPRVGGGRSSPSRRRAPRNTET
ncbi:MAG: hypothetical protein WAM75_16285 [Xanthobacteraceae bacterium]